MKARSSILLVVAFAAGCSTYSTHRYSVAPQNVAALKALEGRSVNVGPFVGNPSTTELSCRGSGGVRTPDGESFPEFVRKAFIDELRAANLFSETATLTLTGKLDSIDFASDTGSWDLALTLSSSNGKTMSLQESYRYQTSVLGDDACNQTAQAFAPAVQSLIGRVARSQELVELTTP